MEMSPAISEPVTEGTEEGFVEPAVSDPAYDGAMLEGGLPSSSEATTSALESARISRDQGALVVSLPQDAQLIVNGHKTTSKGDMRQFVSNGLLPGLVYPYSVKAVMTIDGREVVQTKDVKLRAGQRAELKFDFDAPVETSLTVRVPDEAKVTLSGSETRSVGSERKFVTRRLKAGEVWSDYTVVVTFERDGETLTKEQTIELRAGESRTLTFNFEDEALVASR